MTENGEPDRDLVRKIVRETLKEDFAWEDVTCSLLRPSREKTAASIIAEGSGIIAGLNVAEAAFRERDGSISFNAFASNGCRVRPGTKIASVEGAASSLLSAERTALNFLQHLSGIATLTGAFVDKIKHTGIKILDTRKTTPMLRTLEKYAVGVGGGHNHRYNLKDMILVKENHIRAAGGIYNLLEAIGSLKKGIFVEVEIDTIEFLRVVLDKNINRVMLDNFAPDEVREALRVVEGHCRQTPFPRPEIEVSGGINLDNIPQFAIKGVDYISVGAITNAAVSLNITMEVEG